jgi:hypothetical protein
MRPHLIDARALTLLNPWAHLIAHHGKDVENRSWMPPESVDELLIHAGKGWDRHNNRRPLVGEIGEVVPSAVVAVARLAYACNTSRWIQGVVCACGPWAMSGQCHWRLSEVWSLRNPVPCSGAQGLWRPSPAVLDAVRAQLVEVPDGA